MGTDVLYHNHNRPQISKPGDHGWLNGISERDGSDLLRPKLLTTRTMVQVDNNNRDSQSRNHNNNNKALNYDHVSNYCITRSHRRSCNLWLGKRVTVLSCIIATREKNRICARLWSLATVPQCHDNYATSLPSRILLVTTRRCDRADIKT